MQKIEIKGLAQLNARVSYKEGKLQYGTIELNGREIEKMIAREIFSDTCDDDPDGYKRLEKLVNVTVIIDANIDYLKVNGNEVPLESK